MLKGLNPAKYRWPTAAERAEDPEQGRTQCRRRGPAWARHVYELGRCLRQLEAGESSTERMAIIARADQALAELRLCLGQGARTWARADQVRGELSPVNQRLRSFARAVLGRHKLGARLQQFGAWYGPRRRWALALGLIVSGLVSGLRESTAAVIAGVLVLAPLVDGLLGRHEKV